jgi:hypothetical protein
MSSPKFVLITSIATVSCWLSNATPVVAVTFTEDTLIDCGDTTYDGEDIVVDGCVVTIDCTHTFSRLTIINAGMATHSAGVEGFDLTILGDLAVDVGGAVSAGAKGYGPGLGPGAGESRR